MFSANLVPKHRQNAARRLSPKRNQLRRQLRLESLENRLLMSVSPTLPDTLDASVSSALHYDYGRQPLGFESNRGQTSGPVDFVSRGDGYTLFLTPSEAVISLRSGLGSAESNASVLRIYTAHEN